MNRTDQRKRITTTGGFTVNMKEQFAESVKLEKAIAYDQKGPFYAV